jgi:hypothetical protein
MPQRAAAASELAGAASRASGDATAREFREREFPVGASELPEGIDRRALVQMLGASLSLAGLAACRRPVETIVPFVTPPDEFLPGIPKRYATTMPFGATGYGLLVESHEGRPTKIEGNELHPATRGSASAQMQAAILGLYDPDRSQHVLRRAAPGGELERVAWSDWVAAWQSLEPGLLASGGAGLAILAPPSSSPTLARLAGAVRERFPQLRWATWEPVSDENVVVPAIARLSRPRALQLVLRPRQRRASCVSARCRPLPADRERQRASRARLGGLAGRRARGRRATSMSRLWVVESALTSLTGAMADHRLRLPSGSDRRLRCSRSAERLRAVGIAVRSPADRGTVRARGRRAGAWLDAVVRDLDEHRGAEPRGGVGRRPAAGGARRWRWAINAALGNTRRHGRSLRRSRMQTCRGSRSSSSELVAAMRAGADVDARSCSVRTRPTTPPRDLELRRSARAGGERRPRSGWRADETGARARAGTCPLAHLPRVVGRLSRATDGTAERRCSR